MPLPLRDSTSHSATHLQRMSPQERLQKWRQCEEELSDLAANWRRVKTETAAKDYRTALLRMIENGFREPLDVDAELPESLMPQEYLDLFK